MPDLEEQAQLEESPTSTEQDDVQDLDEGQLDTPDQEVPEGSEDIEPESLTGGVEKAFSDRLKQARQKDLQAERDRVKAELEPQGFTLDDAGKVVPLASGESAQTTEEPPEDEEPETLTAQRERAESLLKAKPADLVSGDPDTDETVAEWHRIARGLELDPEELTAADWRTLLNEQRQGHETQMAREREAQGAIRATFAALETSEVYKLPGGEWKPPSEDARKKIAASARQMHGQMQSWGLTPSQIQTFVPLIGQAAIGANVAAFSGPVEAVKDVRSQTPARSNAGGQTTISLSAEERDFATRNNLDAKRVADELKKIRSQNQ